MRKIDPVKHEAKRRDILDAAGRCFCRDGYQGASISEICAEAKISAGHLYHYFDSKEEIVKALAEASLEKAWQLFSQVAEGDDAIEGFVSQKIRPDRVEQQMLFDLLGEAVRNPAMAKIVQEHSRALRNHLSESLRKGQARGEIDPNLDAEVAAAILMSVIDGSRTLSVRNPKLDMTRSADLLKTLIIRFLAPPRVTARREERRVSRDAASARTQRARPRSLD
jgi:TetR/AcrR family transcriptional repressor of uid operon